MAINNSYEILKDVLITTGGTSYLNTINNTYEALRAVYDPVNNALRINYSGGSSSGTTLFEEGSGTNSTQRKNVSSEASGNYSFVAGGYSNSATSVNSAVIGGSGNRIEETFMSSSNSVIIGGNGMTLSDTDNTVLVPNLFINEDLNFKNTTNVSFESKIFIRSLGGSDFNFLGAKVYMDDRLEVQKNITAYSDIFVNNATDGVVMRTPDGTKQYRLTIDNAGNLVTTLI